jgi:hypothetical protein
MRKATRVIAAVLGAFAGFGGLEHGYFEILQGNARPESILIASMGPPCVPEEVWHICEPAMTILPNYRLTGMLSMGLGLVTLVWALVFVQRKGGGAVLALLSLGLLLFGGGIFPPVIGIAGGLAGTRINTPLQRQPAPFWRVLARLHPWAIILFITGLFSQFVIGYFFNDFLMESGMLIPGSILGLLAVSILAGYGYDVVNREGAQT